MDHDETEPDLPEARRHAALKLAVKVHAGFHPAIPANRVLEMAKVFESYLRGE